jgi:hypothetical protein
MRKFISMFSIFLASCTLEISPTPVPVRDCYIDIDCPSGMYCSSYGTCNTVVVYDDRYVCGESVDPCGCGIAPTVLGGVYDEPACYSGLATIDVCAGYCSDNTVPWTTTCVC